MPHPIIGLAPMDGVTDAAFRYIVARHGKPDVQYTEFVSVEEICRGTASAWRQLRFVDLERPVLAQIYGADPEKFYRAAHIVCALGFDGVDINMGCPAKSVSARGCGAALIHNPPLARAIIRAVQAGVRDWAGGHTITQVGLDARVVEQLQQLTGTAARAPRVAPPVSVKTRIGYDSVVIEDWITTLLEEQPVAITVHGRTLAQMYRGPADWQAIARAARLGRETSTFILGNGDLDTMPEVVERVQATQVHGVLIGRGALGNPWVFRDKAWARHQPVLTTAAVPSGAMTPQERVRVALEHARYFESLNDGCPFVAMRKHLGWYCRGFPGAAEMRAAMFKTTSAADVERLLEVCPVPSPSGGGF